MCERVIWLDTAKGIGILLVVMGHVDLLPSPIVGAIYSFHMPLFFFLSGILLFRKNEGLKSLITKKARTLILPYYMFLTLHFLILYPSYKLGFHHAWNYVPGWQSLSGKSELWFLFVLFFTQLLLSPLRGISLDKKLLIGGGIFVVICLLNRNNVHIVEPIHADKGSTLPFGLDLLFLGGLFVWLGVIAKDYLLDKIIPSSLMVGALFIASFFGAINYCISGYQRVEFLGCFIGNPIFFLLSAVSSIIVVVGVSQRLRKNNWFTRLGRCSLGIYAIHWIFVPFVDAAVYHTLFKLNHTFLYQSLCSIVSCSLILLLTIPMVKLVETRMKWMLGKVTK